MTKRCHICASTAIQLRHEEDRFLYGAGDDQVELVVHEMPVFYCTSCNEAWTDSAGEALRLDAIISYLKSVHADKVYIQMLEQERSEVLV